MRESYLNFEGRTVVVTGGAKGIGRAIASRFARFGATAVVCDVDEKGEELARELQEAGHAAAFVRCSVTDRSQVSALFDTVERQFGGVDVLVNNAGIFPRADFLEMDEAFWANVLDINLKGPYLMCQAAVPGMIRRGSGSIVNIGSLHARVGQPDTTAYAVSKGGIDTMTRNLARQLARHRIRVNGVRPGWIASDGEVARWRAAAFDEETIRTFGSGMPLGRLQTGDDIACAVAFLASELAGQITGQIVTVDGGSSLR